jgi:hypothetical protein
LEEQLVFNFDKYALSPWVHVEQWWCRFFLYVKIQHFYEEDKWNSLAVCICDESWEFHKYDAHMYVDGKKGFRLIEHKETTLEKVMALMDDLLSKTKFQNFITKEKST